MHCEAVSSQICCYRPPAAPVSSHTIHKHQRMSSTEVQHACFTLHPPCSDTWQFNLLLLLRESFFCSPDSGSSPEFLFTVLCCHGHVNEKFLLLGDFHWSSFLLQSLLHLSKSCVNVSFSPISGRPLYLSSRLLLISPFCLCKFWFIQVTTTHHFSYFNHLLFLYLLSQLSDWLFYYFSLTMTFHSSMNISLKLLLVLRLQSTLKSSPEL